MSVVNYAITLRAYPAFRGSKMIFVPERNAHGVVSALETALAAARGNFCNFLMYHGKDRLGYWTNDENKAYGVNALQRLFEQTGLKLYAPFKDRLMDDWRKTLQEVNLHVQSIDKTKKKHTITYHASRGKDDRAMTLIIGSLVAGTFSAAQEEICITETNGSQTLCSCGKGVGHKS